MAMIVGDVIALLRRHEGLSYDVYRCPAGYWTIGYGHLVSRDKRLSKHDAQALCSAPWKLSDCESQLLHQVSLVTQALSARHPWFEQLPERPRLGLINMAYQLGVAGVGRFKRMLAALSAGQWAEAERAALDSKWARQTPRRAREVAALIGNREVAT